MKRYVCNVCVCPECGATQDLFTPEDDDLDE